MFCRFCGKQINDDSKFCKFCGNSLAEDAPVASVSATSPTPNNTDPNQTVNIFANTGNSGNANSNVNPNANAAANNANVYPGANAAVNNAYANPGANAAVSNTQPAKKQKKQKKAKSNSGKVPVGWIIAATLIVVLSILAATGIIVIAYTNPSLLPI